MEKAPLVAHSMMEDITARKTRRGAALQLHTMSVSRIHSGSSMSSWPRDSGPACKDA